MLSARSAFLRTEVRRYATSVVALAVAGVLTALIVHFNLPRQVTGYAFLLVIIGSAWWGGYGPGIVTTLVTLLLGPYLTQPAYSVRHPNATSLPMILLISVLISRMASARETLREANELLDERVRARTSELERVNAALKDRETQLTAQSEVLSRSNADLEQFAYFASHDLQEPLRMIAIYTELLAQSKELTHSEDTSMYMRTVRESVRRMETLVRDLLMYSRAMVVEGCQTAEVDSGEAVAIAIGHLKSKIEALSAEVTTGDLPRVNADQVHLIQIFQNLIGNALKYRSAINPKIIVSAAQIEDKWIFSVSDNGIGIDPKYHDEIFVPFKRLNGHQYPGSGVGLAICKRIVERLGGELWVNSEVGKGATFYFSVPDSSANGLSRAAATECSRVQ